MIWIAFALGIAITLMGALLAVAPDRLIGLAQRASASSLWPIVALRSATGILLLTAAPDSRAPLAFEIFGALSLASALVLPVIGLVRVQEMLIRLARRPHRLLRVHSLPVLGFGLAIAWGASPW
jgi:hypothetical protein